MFRNRCLSHVCVFIGVVLDTVSLKLFGVGYIFSVWGMRYGFDRGFRVYLSWVGLGVVSVVNLLWSLAFFVDEVGTGNVAQSVICK